MIIRRAETTDIPTILEINKQNDFPLPKFENLITQALVEDNGKIIAFGMVKAFAEAILILDKTVPNRKKIEALQNLMLEAIRGGRQHNMTQLHAFIKDAKFEQFMKEHYGFEDCSGKAVVMEL